MNAAARGRRPLRFELLAVSSGDAARSARGSEQLLEWLSQLAPFAPRLAVQVREKALDDRSAFELLRAARRRFPGTLLVNGRADLASAVGADGVHLPARGLPPAALRQRWGDALCLGLSTHSSSEIREAAPWVDYVTFGPVFETPSKPHAAPTGLELLAEAARLGPAVFALGGVDSAEAARAALRAGARGVAGIRLFATPGSLSALF